MVLRNGLGEKGEDEEMEIYYVDSYRKKTIKHLQALMIELYGQGG